MNTELKILLNAYLEDALSPEQEIQFSEMIASGEHDEALTAILKQDYSDNKYILPEFKAIRDRNFQSIEQLVNARTKPATHSNTLIPLLRRWRWAAAAVLILAATGAYLGLQQKQTLHFEGNLHPSTADIEPGRAGAILTLEDGKTVILDDQPNGIIARQGAANVVLTNGELAYADVAGDKLASGVTQAQVLYNTMTTPRGRQFHMRLSDGTKVWLNAASSIRFPAVFTGNKREVEVSGEVYFEVAQDAAKPFRVYYSTNGNINNKRGLIEVLGTQFNINAYPDEAEVFTTLLEGAVRINHAGESALLKPGEQAVIPVEDSNRLNSENTQQATMVIRQANLDQVIGWKDGVFNFNKASLKSAMRQVARWYDVAIVYEKGVPEMEFSGKMQRNLSLSQIMKGLGDEEIDFKIEGKKLIVIHKKDAH